MGLGFWRGREGMNMSWGLLQTNNKLFLSFLWKHSYFFLFLKKPSNNFRRIILQGVVSFHLINTANEKFIIHESNPEGHEIRHIRRNTINLVLKKHSCQVDLWSKENNKAGEQGLRKLKWIISPKMGWLNMLTHRECRLCPEACVHDDLLFVVENLWLFGSVLND